MPRSCSLAAVTRPTPQSRSTGSGWRNSSSPSGGTTSRPSGLATPLATLARNLVRATPTVIGSPTCSRTRAAQPRGDLRGRSRDPLEPADVEERLVDRQPLDQRRRVVEDLEDGLAGVGVGVHARPHDDGLRAEPARLPRAHRGPHPVCLGLVARREHHARPDDHGAAAQAGIVTLLDRCVERVQVGVQDRGLVRHERCSHQCATEATARRVPRRRASHDQRREQEALQADARSAGRGPPGRRCARAAPGRAGCAACRGGSCARPAPCAITSANISSIASAGRTSTRRRASSSPALAKECATPGSTSTTSPGPASTVRRPTRNRIRPSDDLEALGLDRVHVGDRHRAAGAQRRSRRRAARRRWWRRCG